MPDFLYTARNTQGRDIAGRIAAANKREALSVLMKQSLFPLSVEQQRTAALAWLPKPRVKVALVAMTLKQLSDLLENGVPMLGALEVLIDQTAHVTLRGVIVDIRDRVAEGESIDAAFAAHPNVFGELTVSIIRAGAEGAFLEDAFKRAAAFIERQTEMQGRILSAMVYPAALVAVGVGVLIFLLTFIVPRFQPVFDRVVERGEALPLPTTIVLGGSALVFSYWWQTALAVSAVAVYYWTIRRTKRVRRLVDHVKLKIPMLGPVLVQSAVARFCRILGTLLANGVPLLRSLEISSDSTGNQILCDAIVKAADSVSAGETLSKPLSEAGIIPRPVMAMITVAEESNNLENVLVNIADNLDQQLGRQIDLLVRMVEPLLLVIIGASVALIMVGIFLPIFELQA